MKLDAEILSPIYLERNTDEQRHSLLVELNRFLSARILKTSDFDHEVETVIGELRAIGHDLFVPAFKAGSLITARKKGGK